MLSQAARKLGEDAKRKKVWIYDPAYRKWYSPEEFMHNFSYANAPDEFLQRLQLRHPMEGINAGLQRMSDIQTKLSYLMKSVLEYYRK